MKTNTVLDIIKLKNNKTLIGIIDYISTKQIYFFDFSQELDKDFLLLAILWKGNNPNIRFSVYCIIEFPEIKLPRAILIPLSNIEDSSKNVEITKKPKQRQKSIKFHKS